MALLLFSLNASLDTAAGAQFARLRAHIEERFPHEFFLAMTASPPADTSAQANWDWVTLPSADTATWERLLLIYSHWLKPSVSVFYGESAERWLRTPRAAFGTRVHIVDEKEGPSQRAAEQAKNEGSSQHAAEQVKNEGSSQRAAEQVFLGKEPFEPLMNLLERELPVTLVLRPDLTEAEISGRFASRKLAPEARVLCAAGLGAQQGQQLEQIGQHFGGRIHLLLPFREWLLAKSRFATLRFLFRNRGRYQLTVCSSTGHPAAAIFSRGLRALVGRP